jgi:hypothetical protein
MAAIMFRIWAKKPAFMTADASHHNSFGSTNWWGLYVSLGHTQDYSQKARYNRNTTRFSNTQTGSLERCQAQPEEVAWMCNSRQTPVAMK